MLPICLAKIYIGFGMMSRLLTQALSLLLIGALAINSVTSEDWPGFRGPTDQGHSALNNLPVRWSTSHNVTWKRTIPGQGWSSSIVYQGRIYLTTAIVDSAGPARQSLRVLCLGATTGDVLWDREVFCTTVRPIHEKNSFASPTPLSDGQLLFVHFGPEGTVALNLDGQLVWSNDTIQYDARHGGGGSLCRHRSNPG